MRFINLQRLVCQNAIGRTDSGFWGFKREGKSKVKMTKMCADNREICMELSVAFYVSDLSVLEIKTPGRMPALPFVAEFSVFTTRDVNASDAHGHDDVAVAIAFVGEGAHLAGGLFVLELDADGAIGGGGEKIEHVSGVEADRNRIAFVFLLDVFFRFAVFGARRGDFDAVTADGEFDCVRALIGKLRDALDGIAELAALDCDGLIVVARQDGLVIRELAGEECARSAVDDQPGKRGGFRLWQSRFAHRHRRSWRAWRLRPSLFFGMRTFISPLRPASF